MEVNNDIRELREKLRKVYGEITNDFYKIMLRIDRSLELLGGEDGD